MYMYVNPHPQGKRVGDCVKRAIVIASNVDYHSISLMLNRMNKKVNGRGFNDWKKVDIPFIEKCLKAEKMGINWQYANNGKRYTVKQFARTYNKGIYIVQASKHVICVKNGNYLDIWDSGDKSIYNVWEFKGQDYDFDGLDKGLKLGKPMFYLDKEV